MMMMLTLQKGLFADPRKQPQSTSLSQTKMCDLRRVASVACPTVAVNSTRTVMGCSSRKNGGCKSVARLQRVMQHCDHLSRPHWTIDPIQRHNGNSVPKTSWSTSHCTVSHRFGTTTHVRSTPAAEN